MDDFERDWSLKPVNVKGLFDHTKETHVFKYKNGEKGVDIIVPFYTHLNEKNEACGILVNKGWVPHDLKNMKMHLGGIHAGTITGLLYRGDVKTKYSISNEPAYMRYFRVDPYDLSLVS